MKLGLLMPAATLSILATTASSQGAAAGAYYQASRAKEGIPVIPDLNKPSSASDFGRRRAYEQHPATPPGQEGKPGCGL